MAMNFYLLKNVAVNVETPKGINLGFMVKDNGTIRMVQEWFPKRFIIFLEEEKDLAEEIRFRFNVIIAEWLAKKISKISPYWQKLHRAKKPIDFGGIFYDSERGVYFSEQHSWIYSGVSVLPKEEEKPMKQFKTPVEELFRDTSEQTILYTKTKEQTQTIKKKDIESNKPKDRAIIF